MSRGVLSHFAMVAARWHRAWYAQNLHGSALARQCTYSTVLGGGQRGPRTNIAGHNRRSAIGTKRILHTAAPLSCEWGFEAPSLSCYFLLEV